MTTSEPDLSLLRRYRDTGDADAFGEIVRRYTGAVFSTCYRILHDPGSAEDAAQETFYRLMTRPQRVDASLGGWLHRAATRLALDIRRSDTSRRRREAAYHAREPAEASTWADVAPTLDEAIAALPETHRDLLVRHFLKGEHQADLATELNTSPATLSRRIRTAIEALRAELSGRGVSVAPGLLLTLISRNGPGHAPAALRLSLAKLSLFCHARSAGNSLTFGARIRSLPRTVWSGRWALATAAFSVIVTIAVMNLVEHVRLEQIDRTSTGEHGATANVVVSIDYPGPSGLVAQPPSGQADEHVFQRRLSH